MTDCTSKDCEAHLFMVETVKEIKAMNLELMRSQQTLEKSIVKLTENLNELHRMNGRIDEIMEKQYVKEKEQDEAIELQGKYLNRAIGAMLVISFVISTAVNIVF